MEAVEFAWNDLAPFIAIGFLAQLVDSMLGLAFGILSNLLLLLFGLPPAAASSATRGVESFSSGVSGIAHILQRNVDWPLFARLVVPGIAGAVIGLWLLLLLKSDMFRPVLLVYLVALGSYLLWRAPRRPQTFRPVRLVGPLGFFGGLFDASGGGGWGPLVTGNLLAQGTTPRVAIGTANAAEFFITVTVLAIFVGQMGPAVFTIAATGLLIGSVVAAPLGAWLTRRIAPKALLQMVGVVLIATSVWGLASLTFQPLPVFPRM